MLENSMVVYDYNSYEKPEEYEFGLEEGNDWEEEE